MERKDVYRALATPPVRHHAEWCDRGGNVPCSDTMCDLIHVEDMIEGDWGLDHILLERNPQKEYLRQFMLKMTKGREQLLESANKLRMEAHREFEATMKRANDLDEEARYG